MPDLMSRAIHAEAEMHAMPRASMRRWLHAAHWTLRLTPVIIRALAARLARGSEP